MRNTINHPKRGRLVCKIWDNGGETYDRYTAAFKARRYEGHLWYPYLCASANPFHALGFGQHGEAENNFGGPHLGKRITLEQCPADVQSFIMRSI